jgi:hypothetical protein
MNATQWVGQSSGGMGSGGISDDIAGCYSP